MSLRGRHRWCASRISETFSLPLEDVGAAVEVSLAAFQALFSGEIHQALLVWIETPVAVASESAETSAPSPALHFHFSSEAIPKGRTLYFLNVNTDDKAVDPEKAGDGAIVCGEMEEEVIKELVLHLSDAFKPSFVGRTEWGSASDETMTEFMSQIDSLVSAVGTISDIHSHTVELSYPDSVHVPSSLLDGPGRVSKPFTSGISLSDAAIDSFQCTLSFWISSIKNVLSEAGLETSLSPSSTVRSASAGPKPLIYWWKSRMAKLSSITEHIKKPECAAMVAAIQSAVRSSSLDAPVPDSMTNLLKEYREVDVQLTEFVNEAKDNCSYLATLEKFIEPLYKEDPLNMIDAFPALANALYMIGTTARYLIVQSRMEDIFYRIADLLIVRCKHYIASLESDISGDKLWKKNAFSLSSRFKHCVEMSDSYVKTIKVAFERLSSSHSHVKMVEIPEAVRFGKLISFRRRCYKLEMMFSKIAQFENLAQEKIEGMEIILAKFRRLCVETQSHRSDLLAFSDSTFDRDYVEFNHRIIDLENEIRVFLKESFESNRNIIKALSLLQKFQRCIKRDTLQKDIHSQIHIIFQLYGDELKRIERVYEDNKSSPPFARNLPPVSGCISWSRHLFLRIELPMRRFQEDHEIMTSKDAKSIVRDYNRIAKALVTFEYLWLKSWNDSIPDVASSLEAPLLIRSSDDAKKYIVNFDADIIQLIIEAKRLTRLGIAIPIEVQNIVMQETKLKLYVSFLNQTLSEFEDIQTKILPATLEFFNPIVQDIDLRLRPALTSLTWSSINIDAFQSRIRSALASFNEIVNAVNDIISSRIERHLVAISKTLLVDIATNRTYSLGDFIDCQRMHIKVCSDDLHSRNIELENAVKDLLHLSSSYRLDPRIPFELDLISKRLKSHYCKYLYSALLNCCKVSLNYLKDRVSAHASPLVSSVDTVKCPIFDSFIQLAIPTVTVSPSLEEVQATINQVAKIVLSVFQRIHNWSPAFETIALRTISSAKRASRHFDLRISAFSEKEAEMQSIPLLDSDIEEDKEDTYSDDVDLIDREFGAKKRSRDLSRLPSFFDIITQDIEVVRVVLLLTGSIRGTRERVRSVLSSFTRYEWLWKRDTEDTYQKFLASNPQLEDFEAEFRRFLKLDLEIEHIPVTTTIGAFNLLSVNLKSQLKLSLRDWLRKYSDNLHSKAKISLFELSEYIRNLMHHLGKKVDGLPSLAMILNILKEIRAKQASFESIVNPIYDTYSMLELYEIPVEKEEKDVKSSIPVIWKKLLDKSNEVADDISSHQTEVKKSLLADVKVFRTDVVIFRGEFDKHGPMVQGLSPQVAMERLKRFEDEYEIRERKMEIYGIGEELFGIPKTEYAILEQTGKDLRLLSKLYSLYKDVMTKVEQWKDILWSDVVVNISNMTNEMDQFSSRCKKLPKRLKEWQAYIDLDIKIENFQNILPLLQEMSKTSIRPRHWEAIEKLTSCHLKYEDTEFRLSDLLKAPLVERHDDIVEVTDGADKEMNLQKKLEDVITQWKEKKFNFLLWKNRGVSVMAGEKALLDDLDEAQMNLQTMLTSKHIRPFKEDAVNMLHQLSNTSDTLSLWSVVQSTWCSLEVVFLTGDISKQMPVVSKKFQKIDKDFIGLMTKAFEVGIVVTCCENEVLKQALPSMNEELQRCQKELDGYLEQKRNKFPRFYFVSGPVLLQILSKGSDPFAVQEYYKNVFAAITKVEHDRKEKHIILSVMNEFGKTIESVDLSHPIKAQGNIEEWLNDLLFESRVTLKKMCSDMSREVVSLTHSISSSLKSFIDSQISQYSLLGIQLLWTSIVQNALETIKVNKNSVKEACHVTDEILNLMSSWCLSDLGSKMNRTKIETLVTIQVHQKDVIDDLFKLYRSKKLTSHDDFEWLKQARFFWDPIGMDDINDEGALIMKITDITFTYQYEFLGCKERLVVTPLTDRCYIALAQAFGMYYGGSPAGPAGTGKTETVKDMGNSLGIFVIVTNCSSEMRHLDCAKLFKGLCQSGLWGCFDEFNRITLPVLSVVAQQIQSINDAKKSNSKAFTFLGEPNVSLNPVCGIFITMNPGYAGRQELPENLKMLFRGVAMMVPDREIIIRVKLCSVGYAKFQNLAKKFFICYQLCEQQLSKQKHYDFGLRNILSVLRTAGATKRENLEESEEVLLYRTLRDMNLSKLIAQDVPLFLSMLADLFPSVESPAKKEFPALMAELSREVSNEGLIMHPSWVTKVLQLHETCLVRHGVMLVGPAGSGKSKIIKMLQKALENTLGVSHRSIKLNPKALEANELYGRTDSRSGEWVKGIFASIWEKYNNMELPSITWIIEDGPVDTLWIEDLNSVLDDNKLLTLSNGDRFPMTDNTKIMFENENLNNASPATVSRAGIIYVSDTDLDWLPVIQAYIKKQPLDIQDYLTSFFLKYFGICHSEDPGHLFRFLIKECNAIMSFTRIGLSTNCMKLFSTLLIFYENRLSTDKSSVLYSCQLERLFIFSLFWSIGGVLEVEDRKKLETYITKLHASSSTSTKDILPSTAISALVPSIYDLCIDGTSVNLEWRPWKVPVWEYPSSKDEIDFANLLIPTMDSTRIIFNVSCIHSILKYPLLLVGGPGTAKTSTALMYFQSFNQDKMLLKRVNFSSITSPRILQDGVESGLDKRGGRTYGPANNKKMTIFIDDVSMPEINNWGDQPTNELTRQLIEESGLYFLDKDRRGDFKICEDLLFIAAMNHPGNGRNDIPNRLKRQFFIMNLILPALKSIDDLYGKMLKGRFPETEFSSDFITVVSRLTKSTIDLWNKVKVKMLPTPAKFHYIFNMRELSRVFQGILLIPKESIKTGGSQVMSSDMIYNILQLWKFECSRVMQDKLTNDVDKKWFQVAVDDVTGQYFGADYSKKCAWENNHFVNFFRDDVYDEEEVLVAEAPKVYENGGTLENIRKRVLFFMDKYNTEFSSIGLNLILFDDALFHLVRIVRILSMPRGNALLVGIGGSGKQSLTRLSAYICRSILFRITLTKNYTVQSFKDELKILIPIAGHTRKHVTFLLTDSEIKDENFLEYMNSLLMTGEISGLFAKDEIMAMCSDLSASFSKEYPDLTETQDNLYQYFIQQIRKYLHIVLCFSPVNVKFSERARKFPGLVNGTTINWFLPWPEEALISVSRGILSDFKLDIQEVEESDRIKEQLMVHMGIVHKIISSTCTEYFNEMRRRIYQTPKSYLSFIYNYRSLYAEKLKDIQIKEANILRGLEKLLKGASDVEQMKIVLASEQIKLDDATKKTNEMLKVLQVDQRAAEIKGQEVAVIKSKCEIEKNFIENEAKLCQADLDRAQPIVDRANEAINSIQPADITVVKRLGSPADIIRLVFDGVLILLFKPLLSIEGATVTVSKQDWVWVKPSWDSAMSLMNDTSFLSKLQSFKKDSVNEETVELIGAYVDLPYFSSEVAGKAAGAAKGLATWVEAMKDYYYASRMIRPKLEALSIAKVALGVALKALHDAEDEEKIALDKIVMLRNAFDKQMNEKSIIEMNAMALRKKMEQASALIGGLSGERVRWTSDAKNFADLKKRLIGDCSLACSFISYLGAFNWKYRTVILEDKLSQDLRSKGLPFTNNLDIVSFLVDKNIIGDWNLDGLPRDNLSSQNGILVTKSSRYPLLIDPQGQALQWIVTMESRKEKLPLHPTISINSTKLKDMLEFCMQEGKSLLVVNVEEDLDPLLDPILEKQIIKRGRKKFIKISDGEVELDDAFNLFFITRLANPHFSPELQAKTTIVDFTVTLSGLEDQLLGLVIQREQKALEDSLDLVLSEVNMNRKALTKLDSQLLEKLSSNKGNLLEEEGLIEMLSDTKYKAADVSEKLVKAEETKRAIADQREQYRSVATRGSLLYFSIVDMSLVNIMYQTSLDQFISLFQMAISNADKSTITNKRVNSIIETMTYLVFRYIQKGLYEKDKILFSFIITSKILLMNENISSLSEVSFFLRGGAALDMSSVVKRKPVWLSDEIWLNIICLSDSVSFYKALPDTIIRNDYLWNKWFDNDNPEVIDIPDFEASLLEKAHQGGPWLRLLLLRSFRVDRLLLSVRRFIKDTPEMGMKYIEANTDTIEMVFEESNQFNPIIILLSQGADPTESIQILCKKRRNIVACISMGEGQEVLSKNYLKSAIVNGSWVLLQNCELGLNLMDELEDYLKSIKDSIHHDFRLFITTQPEIKFPLGLLQMSIKLTNEPPSGLQAGLSRSFTAILDQDKLERIDIPSISKIWRILLFSLSFLHSVVQERKKFNSLGWCIPYEFNSGDLSACITYLERHLYTGNISWNTIQYMISEVQYGGKITDEVDRRLFNTYCNKWISMDIMEDKFTYNPRDTVTEIPNHFVYTYLDTVDIGTWRKYASSFPEIDSPEIMGLHPNADVTFRIKEVYNFIDTLGETLPKGGGSSSSGGKGVKLSMDDIVMNKTVELLEDIPEYYIEDDYLEKIRKLGGLVQPMNIFLYQELQRFQFVLVKVRNSLIQIQLAIKGEVIVTDEILSSMNDLFIGKVPKSWLVTPGGDEFSWLLPSLGVWFTSMIARDKQFKNWLNTKRPDSFWITGFYNPQGFLTAMKQEVTRMHRKDSWSIDDTTYWNEFKDIERLDQVKECPKEGVYIHGLNLEGAKLEKKYLAESDIKKLFFNLPILYVTTISKDELKKKMDTAFGSTGPYICPVYRYANRTDKYLIFSPYFSTKVSPEHWILRGVAALCITN